MRGLGTKTLNSDAVLFFNLLEKHAQGPEHHFKRPPDYDYRFDRIKHQQDLLDPGDRPDRRFRRQSS